MLVVLIFTAVTFAFILNDSPILPFVFMIIPLMAMIYEEDEWAISLVILLSLSNTISVSFKGAPLSSLLSIVALAYYCLFSLPNKYKRKKFYENTYHF